MFSIGMKIVREIEKNADSATAEEILQSLRRLSLDDFGDLIISLPNPQFPNISRKLPAMASAEVQNSWTGSHGFELLRQTLAFTKQLEVNCTRYLQRPLRDIEIMDFGCGYGRFIRMLYYYTSPDKIWGIDAWSRSLEKCREVGLLGNFALSEQIPEVMPVKLNKFDLAFSFSVFTHLSPRSIKACLAAIRKSINTGGVFIATIRPVEFWPYLDKMRGSSHAENLTREHEQNGFAYLPHAGAEGEFYGDISCNASYLAQEGWELIGYDSTILDNFQVSVLLRAV